MQAIFTCFDTSTLLVINETRYFLPEYKIIILFEYTIPCKLFHQLISRLND